MPFIFDNLTATVIAMTIVLILSSIQLRSTQQRVAQTSQEIVQRRARAVTDWMEEDLGKIGRNMSSDDDAFDKPEAYYQSPENEEEWLTRTFAFRRDSIAGGDIWRIETRYHIADSTSVEGDIETVYQIVRERRRKELGGTWSDSDWVAGGRIHSLEYFDVDLLNRNAQETNNKNAVRSIRVRFSVVAPFQNEEMSFPASRTNVVVVRYPLADS